jgi:hypothetical protein
MDSSLLHFRIRQLIWCLSRLIHSCWCLIGFQYQLDRLLPTFLDVGNGPPGRKALRPGLLSPHSNRGRSSLCVFVRGEPAFLFDSCSNRALLGFSCSLSLIYASSIRYSFRKAFAQVLAQVLFSYPPCLSKLTIGENVVRSPWVLCSPVCQIPLSVQTDNRLIHILQDHRSGEFSTQLCLTNSFTGVLVSHGVSVLQRF